MRLATVRIGANTRAVRLDPDRAVDLGVPDVGALLRLEDWSDRAARSDGDRVQLGEGRAPLVVDPRKVICVGLNYRDHILEMGHDLPAVPTLFAKFADALVGDGETIELDPASSAWDWEAELALVIGRDVRKATTSDAESAIAGFTVMNDVTARDFQNRTKQWLQGKTFENTAPLGPELVTPDELLGGCRPTLDISCSIDGEIVQRSNTRELVFDPVALVEYVSHVVTLRPGDIISTGTPGGVGHARTPPRYLETGATVVTEIEHIGRLRNPTSDRDGESPPVGQ